MSCLLQTSSSSTPSCDIAEPYPSISTLCQVLKLILQETDEKNKGFFTCFDAVKVPTITLRDFLVRIMKFSNCSDDEILVLALIYIDRIGKKREGFMMNSQKIHRLLFTAIIVAIKFSYDTYYKNEYYAKVGGVSLKEFNLMEKEFLFLINFHLFVDSELLKKYEKNLKLKPKKHQDSHVRNIQKMV